MLHKLTFVAATLALGEAARRNEVRRLATRKSHITSVQVRCVQFGSSWLAAHAPNFSTNLSCCSFVPPSAAQGLPVHQRYSGCVGLAQCHRQGEFISLWQIASFFCNFTTTRHC